MRTLESKAVNKETGVNRVEIEIDNKLAEIYIDGKHFYNGYVEKETRSSIDIVCYCPIAMEMKIKVKKKDYNEKKEILEMEVIEWEIIKP